MEEKGILYVATADRFLDEASISVKSAKERMPDIPTILYTHSQEYRNKHFDEIKVIEDFKNLNSDKINPILDTPFKKTLFLDTDTYFCDDVTDVFELLDRYDLAVTHAYHRRPFSMPCPDCFPEVNGGVIFYKMNDSIKAFFEEWKRLYKELYDGPRNIKKDQPSLRQVLYESNIQSYILPPEYNLRPQFPAIIGKGERMKIMHIRHPDLESWVKKINHNPNILRVTVPTWEYLDSGHLIVIRGSFITKVIKKLLSIFRLVRNHKVEHF